jgi:hypothetical protein
MSGAGKPSQSFIIADKLISGKSNVEEVSSQTGITTGTSVGETTNLGKSFPVLSGIPTSEATDQKFLIQKAGGNYTAGWVWKPVAAENYYGTYDSRRFWGYHTPIVGTPGSDNLACAYSYEYQRIVHIAINQANDNVNVRFLQDDSNYYAWDTSPTWILTNSIATGHHSAAMAVLDDGRLMLVIRTEGNISPTIDYDVYHSVDGGVNFTLVSERIIDSFTFDATFGTQDTDNQFRLGVSGDFIRLCFVTGSGVLNTWLSRDRGITWQRITVSPGTGDFSLGTTGDPDDPYPFDLVDVDDSGTFLATVINPSSPTGTESATCKIDGQWGALLAVSSVGYPANVKSITLVRADNYIWQFVNYYDFSIYTTGWTFRRVLSQNWQNWIATFPNNGWQELEAPIAYIGDNYPGRLLSCWAKNRIFLQCANKNHTTGSDRNYAMAWFHGGWDTFSVGRSAPSIALDQLVTSKNGSDYLIRYAWNAFVGEPNASYNLWTPVTVGTGTITWSVERVKFSVVATADESYMTTAGLPDPGPNWGAGGNASMYGFTCRVGVGVGDVTLPNLTSNDIMGVRLAMSNTGGGGRYDILTVRVDAGRVRLVSHDPVSPTDDTITGLDLSSWTEIRVSLQQNASTLQLEAQVAVYNNSTKKWVFGNSIVRNFQAGVSPTNYPQEIGCLEPGYAALVPYALEMTSYWTIDNIPDSIRIVDPTNPSSLFGQVMSPRSIQTEHGMLAAWSGVGAAIGDSFTGQVEYSYPAESSLTDCPRIQWRSNPTRLSDQLVAEHNNFAGASWSNPGAATVTISANAQTNPYGVALSADNINVAAGVIATPVGRTEAQTTEGAGYTVTFWARTNLGTGARSITIGVSSGTVSPSIDLNDSWSFHEVSVIAGSASPGYVEIWITAEAGSPWNFSFYDFRASLQPYIIYDANPTNPASNQLRKFNHTAAATFGSNVRKWLVDYSDASDFAVSSTVAIIDATLFNTANVPFAVTQASGNQLSFSPNTRIVRGSLLGKYIRFVTGLSTATDSYSTWKVIDHELDNTIVVETYQPAGNPEVQGVVADDQFVVFNSAAAVYYGETRGPFRYVRLRAQDEQVAGVGPTVAESPFQLGTAKIGRRVQIDVPLDWSFTDNEQPNVTTYRTRGAVTWAYTEGPPQRTITGRLVGDVERYRDVVRYFQRYLQYETRSLVLILDDDLFSGDAPAGPEKWVILARLISGNEQENAAWYFDSDGVLRVAGDLSLTFNEEV